MSSNKVKSILGTMEFGRRLNLEGSKTMSKAFIDAYSREGPIELDTAFMYGGGETEKFIGQMDLRLNDNVQIATKANPRDNKLLDAAGVRKQLETSLNRMKLKSVQIFYLHAPDPKTPITDTLKAVNDLYQEKKFKEFGLSNYAAWQVAEICTICKNQSWIRPTVYQGMYNCLTRSVEKELFPCLRQFNLRFYAYNPLCGGLLTGKHKIEDANKNEPGRFFGNSGKMYLKRYWKNEVFDAVTEIKKILQEVYDNKVSITEASLRWLYNHSKLDASCGDGVILGASSIDQLNFNIKFCKQGPLDNRVIEVLDKCWNACCYNCPDYMR